MTPRTTATAAAVTSLVFGAAGILAPGSLGSAFGISMDPTATALARLACAAYLGYAALAWLVRDVADRGAWRAVAGANSLSWGLSACVVAAAVASGMGDARTWAVVVLQAFFAAAWALAYGRATMSASAAR
jgi:hypothetical protein